MTIYSEKADTSQYFNTSPSTRGFLDGSGNVSQKQFQYQPLHEGLRRFCRSSRAFQISIPAPPRGASEAGDGTIINLISIPAPPRGASSRARPRQSPAIFQYQPLHEGLLRTGLPPVRLCYFNTSPSTRGFLVSSRRDHSWIFQYQPLHEGLLYNQEEKFPEMISIPAPPRGAS